jgi:hypothetical protein
MEEVFCVILYSGQIAVGKYSDQDEEGTTLKDPRVVSIEQQKDKNIVRMTLLSYIGEPEFIFFKEKDINLSYTVTNKELLSQYIRSTSSLEVVPAGGFDPKKGMN